MQLRNIRPFSQYEPGDVVEVPDGAAFDDFHWEIALLNSTQERQPSREVHPITDDEGEPPAVPASPVQFPPLVPKEM